MKSEGVWEVRVRVKCEGMQYANIEGEDLED